MSILNVTYVLDHTYSNSCNYLSVFPASLTIPVLNMLLNELLCVSKVPPGVKHVDLDLSTLPPTTAMAVVIYNRW